EPPQRRLHVRQRTLERGARLQRRAAHPGFHGLKERIEVDLALRGQLHRFGGGRAQLLRQELNDWDAALRQLGDDLALHLVRRRNLVEDQAHVAHGRTRDRRRVRNELQRSLQVLTRLHTRRDRRRRNRRRLVKPERGAL